MIKQKLIGILFCVAGPFTPFVTSSRAFSKGIAELTFGREIAPILSKNCVRCHQPAGIASAAPFVSYDTVRPWAKAIKEKVVLGEMPPWPPDPDRSLKFRNDARLSHQDIETLVAWVDAGAPKGGDANVDPAPESGNGWLYPGGRKPDLVISIPGEFRVPATGVIPYLRFLVKVPLPEDKWIEACQARPGNSAVVHHMAITEVEMDERVSQADLDAVALLTRRMGIPGGLGAVRPAVTSPSNPALFDMLGIYTPGSTIEIFGDDTAKLLKGGKNRYINFNIHYQPTGKEEKDVSQIAFWFRDTPPKHELYRVPGAADAIVANGKELLRDVPGVKAEGTGVVIPPIPPGVENYELIGVTAYTSPVTIYQLHPHAHLRAKDFKYVAVYPDGHEETLLTVPKYDFRWQLAYELEKPLTLPAGSKMVVTAHYDNSANNKFNPAPEKEVYFRDQNQSWDEMFSPFVQFTIDGGSSKSNEAAALPIVEAVGCLVQNPSAEWVLNSASVAVTSQTQGTTAAALEAAASAPLSTHEYHLLGADIFSPSSKKGRKVAVKGVLIGGDEKRLNVTSLQTVGVTCAR